MKLSVGIGDTLCACMFQAWRAYDDGQNGALLNSDGCLVVGARVGVAPVGKRVTEGVGRLLLFSAKVRWCGFVSRASALIVLRSLEINRKRLLM